MNINSSRIAFIGAGNMARSIIGGLVSSGYNAGNISASDPFPGSLKALETLGPVETTSDNTLAVRGAEVVVLAVKPQVMSEALESISAAVSTQQPLIISIAAGITCANMSAALGADTAIVRCMPNTPALMRLGATALFATSSVSAEQRKLAENILASVGKTVWVETEGELDAVTALSGSGPAYFFLLIEAMQKAGEAMGLDAETVRVLTQQTAVGAAHMAMDSDVDVAELRKRVTSPGGTTQRALEIFAEHDFEGIVEKALRGAQQRSVELG